MRNSNGTFKKGFSSTLPTRTVLGKMPAVRRRKNVAANSRGVWQYQEDRPDCVNCGMKARYHSKNPDGSVKYWRNLCTMCHKNQGQKQYKYRIHKKPFCETCGFIASHRVQLDVDHIDGNHNNDSPENLQTICANCHRLKTVVSGDHNGVKYIPANQGIISERVI